MEQANNIPVLSTKQFSYDKVTKTFLTDISAIPDFPCVHQFYLVSQNTGLRVLFVLTAALKDSEGDFIGWTFKAPPIQFRQDTKIDRDFWDIVKDITVKIYND